MTVDKRRKKRKQYRSPRVVTYGDLQQLTQGGKGIGTPGGPTKGGLAQDGGAGGPKSKATGKA